MKSKYEVPNGHAYAPTKSEEYWPVEVRKVKQGYFGLFAKEFIPSRSVVFRDGGVVVSSVDDVPKDKCYAVLLAENLFLAPPSYEHLENICYLNHSCDSNIARIGGLVYLSKRDIRAGEELTVDYAPLIAGLESWELACQCKSANCRKVLTSHDWKNPVLAQVLWEEWLPFMQKKIIRLRAQA